MKRLPKESYRFRCDEPIARIIDRMASTQDRSKSAVVNRALREFFEDELQATAKLAA